MWDRNLKHAKTEAEGLAMFVPPYFMCGVYQLKPGSLNTAAMPPLSARPLLRLLTDREATQTSSAGYLCSRCRAMEANLLPDVNPFGGVGGTNHESVES